MISTTNDVTLTAINVKVHTKSKWFKCGLIDWGLSAYTTQRLSKLVNSHSLCFYEYDATHEKPSLSKLKPSSSSSCSLLTTLKSTRYE